MKPTDQVSRIREAHESVNEAGARLESIINQTALSLDDALNFSYPVDASTTHMMNEIHTNLNITNRRATLQTRIGSPTPAPGTGIHREIHDKNNAKTPFVTQKSTAQATMQANRKMNNATEIANYTTAQNDYNTAEIEIQKINKDLKDLQDELTKKETELKGLDTFDGTGIHAADTITRRAEIGAIRGAYSTFDTTSTISHQSLQLGSSLGAIQTNLTGHFFSTPSTSPSFSFYDSSADKSHTCDRADGTFVTTARLADGSTKEIEIKGIHITGTPPSLHATNLEVLTTDVTYPLHIRDLSVRGSFQDSHGRTFHHDKKLSLTINSQNSTTRNTNYATRYANLESVMTIPTLQTQLDNIRNNNYETFEKEAFFKIIENDDIFKTMPDAQKDDLYRIMQGMPIIGGGALANIIPNPPVYADFRTRLLAYKTPQTFTNESDYRDRVRSNLPNIIQEYMTDTLKTHTDSSAVRTTIKKALLDYDNESLQANAMRFDRRIANNIRNFDPETHRVKPRWKFWARGEEQNYLSFFQHQNTSLEKQSVHDGTTEHTYDLSLSVSKGNNVSATVQTGDGKELSFTGRSHTALMRSILRSPEIDSHHLRCHAAMSVAKGITKLAHENNIQLLSPIGGLRNRFMEMRMDGDKLVAESYHLNAGTRSKVNKQTIFDESLFQGKTNISQMTRATERLMESTNHTLNNAYRQRHNAKHTDFLQRPLLKKHRYGGLPSLWKKLSFEGESLEISGQSYNVSCDNGLFEITGGALEKPLKGRNLGKLIAYKPELRGLEMKVLSSTNQKLIDMYRSHEKVAKHNYGVYDPKLKKTYIINANGDIGVVDIDKPNYTYGRRRFMGSNSDYGRIPSSEMPHGMRILNDHEKTSFLQNAELVGKTIRAMAKTHRARF